MALRACCRGLSRLMLGGKATGALRSGRGVQMSRDQRLSLRAAGGSRDASADPSPEQKAKALLACMKEINSRFGKGTIMQLGSTPMVVETIPSGALTLDVALGGGYPKGRIIEVYGPESSGKTTLALHAIAEVQRQGHNAALVDAEHAFDPVYSRVRARLRSLRAGVNVDELWLTQPNSGEEALEIVDQLVRSNCFAVIAIDSVAALTPRAEIEGEIGAVQVGSQARLMSQALRKITSNASKSDTTIIFLNQLRHKIGVIYGNPEVTTGGQALKFYASARLEVRRKQTIEGAKGENIGIRVKAKVVKNKCAPPYKIAEFDILFGSGISGRGCLLDAAEAVDVVQKRGSWYYYGDNKLAQGRDKTLGELGANADLAREIEAKTRAKLSGEVDINDVYAAAEDKAPDALLGAGVEDEEEEEAPEDLDELLKGAEIAHVA